MEIEFKYPKISVASLYEQLKQQSLLRSLQLTELSKHRLQGKILDFGGGDGAQYRSLIKSSNYESVNIDKNIKPTFLIEPDDCIPVNDCIYDNVISLNTIEHVYNAKETVQEMCRVLKPGGQLIVSTPFLFRIHGHPDDFFRPTASWYIATLKEQSFEKIIITPLSVGNFSTGIFCMSLSNRLSYIPLRFAIITDFLISKAWAWRGKSTHGKSLNTALGFWIVGIK